MATKKPRITITLERTTYETLSRLSAAGGDSMSEIVTGFLSLCVPSMERMVLLLERAKAAPQEARAGLAAALARAEERSLPALVVALEQQDLFLADLLGGIKAHGPGATEDAQRPQAGAVLAVAERDPRLVTRGSGHGKTLTKAPAKGVRHGKV